MSKVMILDTSCKTCKWNFSGVCASHESEHYYGYNIDDLKKERTCWEEDLNYFIKLTKKLPKNEREEFLRGNKGTDYLLSRLFALGKLQKGSNENE